MSVSKISFLAPTTNADGSPLTLPLTFKVYIDTVNPPVKSYDVPASIAVQAGSVTATFAQLGFTPAANEVYYAGATAIDSAGESALSTVAIFTYAVVPATPTGFTVS